jgi:YHS domain-containing protein
MVRAVLYLFLAIILISVLRSVIGVIGKLFGALTEAPGSARSSSSSEPKSVGELKRDPVCGTYVSTAASVKRTINGQVVHFCSEACSRKHQKSS